MSTTEHTQGGPGSGGGGGRVLRLGGGGFPCSGETGGGPGPWERRGGGVGPEPRVPSRQPGSCGGAGGQRPGRVPGRRRACDPGDAERAVGSGGGRVGKPLHRGHGERPGPACGRFERHHHDGGGWWRAGRRVLCGDGGSALAMARNCGSQVSELRRRTDRSGTPRGRPWREAQGNRQRPRPRGAHGSERAEPRRPSSPPRPGSRGLPQALSPPWS